MTRSPSPTSSSSAPRRPARRRCTRRSRGHPDVFVTTPKEPKYWLCDGAPPPALARPRRRALPAGVDLAGRRSTPRSSAGAAERQVRGESTPFYLWSRGAHRRIAEALPEVRLIAVVRDPIDRAYSNWMHLWSDGLEPDRRLRGRRSPARTSGSTAGWAPFWRYRELGLYGEQLAHLYRLRRRRTGCWCCATATSSTTRAPTVDRACRFLGIREGLVDTIPRDNCAASSRRAGGRRCSAR